jgi:hypothetical protein
MYFQPTDPNFFTIWNRNHRYFFLRLISKLFQSGAGTVYLMYQSVLCLTKICQIIFNYVGNKPLFVQNLFERNVNHLKNIYLVIFGINNILKFKIHKI